VENPIEFELVVGDDVVRDFRELTQNLRSGAYIPVEQSDLIRRFFNSLNLTLNPHTHNATLWRRP